ncbi:MAG: 1-hydroxycarotenoid 3,4-desaturase CrtD [Hyphomicrobiales bacterium]
MTTHHAVIVGAGIGGLSAALSLAGQGLKVTLLEAQPEVGGKMRAVPVGGSAIDGGPTVFTMKWVFDELFDEAGLNFDDSVGLTKAELLARHAWDDSGTLDLFADLDQSADAIGDFCGAKEAANFRQFAQEAAAMYATLEQPFLRSSKPSMLGMSARLGPKGLAVKPFSTLWRALNGRFDDPRLVQLFGRYSTYTGASPFMAPATLMLIAHVELDGVWLVKGGMRELAQVMRRACEAKGVVIQTSAKVARIETDKGAARAVILENGERHSGDVVVVNADASAIGSGLFGADVQRAVDPVKPTKRSLSAIGWTLKARTDGFLLAHHSVFFGQDYPEEFDAVFQRSSYPGDPTVYICAQDRADTGGLADPDKAERMLMVINAPPNGDQNPDQSEMEQCMERSLARLEACGLKVEVEPAMSVPTGPKGFNRLFPATGGALYGRANHSPVASFQRPDNRTKIPGLYLAGGSVHPGPGVPMAALSGRLAAARIVSDLASTRPSRRTVTVGGMSTA